MKIAIAFLLLTAASFGQASPSFEVVSVKPSGPNSRGNYYSFNHDGANVENGTLSGLIETGCWTPRRFHDPRSRVPAGCRAQH
jgi:hypothetical protein